MITILKSMVLFVLAGLFEIGGGYMVWLSLREGRPWWIGVLGGLILIGYGVVATFQPANFGRVYAAYGGIFIVMDDSVRDKSAAALETKAEPREVGGRL